MSDGDLKNLSDDELEKELLRRKEEKAAKATPKPLAKPDFTELIGTIVDGIEQAVRDRRAGKDFDHYVCEAAVEAVYGKDFWNWWNSKEWKDG